jgi:prepilin-type N-terminal cleavage/methylation domain-containing protein
MRRAYPPDAARNAFTLIELLVVIVIIGVLAAIALPIYNTVMTKSRQSTTLNNMRQVGSAFLLYAGDNNGQLPGRFTATNQVKWPGLMAPYVQNLNVYLSPIPEWMGKQATQAQLNSMVPTNAGYSNGSNYTDYIANGYNDLAAYSNPNITPRLSMIAVPSQVILLGIEYPGANNFYMDFVEGNEQTANHVLDKAPTGWSGSVYVFCDGSSQFLTDYPAGDTTGGATSKPPSGNYYTDWLWLMDKSNNPTGTQ